MVSRSHEQRMGLQEVDVVVQTQFETELEIFRTEEETAQQYFFSYLSVRSLAAKNTAVLAAMNTTPLFWITTHHAMLLSAIVALGRIFDQRSKHNIDRLMSIASGVFTAASARSPISRRGPSAPTTPSRSEPPFSLTSVSPTRRAGSSRRRSPRAPCGRY